MREAKLGALDCRVTGGPNRDGDGNGPVVVLLHGFGAPGHDLVGLWRVLDVPEEVRFVFPEAPLSLGGMGFGEARAWWMIDVERLERAIQSGQTRDMSEEVPEGLAQAREQLVTTLDAVEQELDVGGDRVVVGGFSQGAMLALDTVLRTERSFAGTVLMSSTLLAREQWCARMAAREGMPVLQSHGEQDPLLPFSLAEELREHLREAGLHVQWVPFQGGHEIPARVLARLGGFLQQTLGYRRP